MQAPKRARLPSWTSATVRLTLGPWLLLMMAAWPAAAQTGTGTVTVRVRSGAAPVSSADVTAGGLTVQTDVKGEARLTLPAGEQTLPGVCVGLVPPQLPLSLRAGEEVAVTLQLQEQPLVANLHP